MPIYKDIVYIDWTLVFTIVNTLILFFVLKHFLYKPVKKMLDGRKDEVQKIYDDANSANTTAQALKAEYETQVATAKEQAGDIIKTATQKAQSKSDELLSQAQAKASATLSRAESQIEVEKKKAVNEIKDEIVGLAIVAAQQVVKKELSAQDHEKLINDFIENAGDVKWQS